jgi:ribosome-associated protein
MLLVKALIVKKPRKPSKPSKASKLKRLESKKNNSELKQSRRKLKADE